MSVRRIFLRRDTAANWSSENPVLSEGEPGFDTTNEILKVGNGTTPWNSLSQFQEPQGVSSDSYSEPTFTSGVLESITTWTDSGKGTKVGTKAFTYTNGNLTSVVEKDGSDATTLTKTLTYDAEGNLASITKDYA